MEDKPAKTIFIVCKYIWGENMPNKKMWLMILSFGIIVCVGAFSLLVVPKLSVDAKAKDWVGAWNVDITVVNQNARFPGLISFFSDGNLITDESPSPLETSGHGSWVSTGDNRAVFSFSFLYGSANPAEWMKGTGNGRVSYDPRTDRWSGPFSISIVDQTGAVILNDTGMMSGARIAPQP
jgi:hypothetical protein